MATLTVSSRSLTVSADDKNTQNEPILDNEMELEAEENHPSDEHSSTTHVYKRRWIIILLYCLYAMTNSYQWIHLNIIGNIVIKYYRESLPDDKFQRETSLDWLSMIYMIVYIPLVFPGTFLLKKKGVRVCLVAGAFLNALGAWLKVACVSPDRFPVLMFAQTVCALAQIFTLGLPAKIAAVWFGPNEVSTATSIGIFGFQVYISTLVMFNITFIFNPLMGIPNVLTICLFFLLTANQLLFGCEKILATFARALSLSIIIAALLSSKVSFLYSFLSFSRYMFLYRKN